MAQQFSMGSFLPILQAMTQYMPQAQQMGQMLQGGGVNLPTQASRGGGISLPTGGGQAPPPKPPGMSQQDYETMIRYGNTQNTRMRGAAGFFEGLVDARRASKLEPEVARIQKESDDAAALKEEMLKQSRGDDILQKTGDKVLAAAAFKSEDNYKEIIKQIAEKEYAEDPAIQRELIAAGFKPGTPEYRSAYMQIKTPRGTTVNVGGETNPWDKLPAGHYPKHPDRFGDPKSVEDLETVNMADIGKQSERVVDAIQSADLTLMNTQKIRDVMETGVLPDTGFGGAAVRAATQMMGPKPKEGEVGLFTSFTDAGEIDRLLEPIKSRIGLAAINNMRKMSETGGALGNVSNFEVRVVQNSIANLDPNRGKEQFKKDLDTVDTVMKRQAFLTRNADDLEERARKSGQDPTEYILNELQKRYPLSEDFLSTITLDEEGDWEGQGGVQMQPGMQLSVGEGDTAVTKGGGGVYNPATGKIEW